MTKAKELNIPGAAKYLNYTRPYVRALIRNKKIKTTLRPIAPNAKVKRHMIAITELKKFQLTRITRTRRKDGRNKYILYVTPGEHQEVLTALKNAGLQDVADLIVRANPQRDPKEEEGD